MTTETRHRHGLTHLLFTPATRRSCCQASTASLLIQTMVVYQFYSKHKLNQRMPPDHICIGPTGGLGNTPWWGHWMVWVRC